MLDVADFRPDATATDTRELCQIALELGFHGVCVSGARMLLAATMLEDSPIQVIGVVGSPFGVNDSETKRFETESLIDLGAQEIEVVLSVGRLRDGDDKYVLRELRDVVEAAEAVPVKAVLEVALLSEDQQQRACSLAIEAGARFIVLGTGMGTNAITVEQVERMSLWTGEKVGVKSMLHSMNEPEAAAFVQAGANRIGRVLGIQRAQDLQFPDLRAEDQE